MENKKLLVIPILFIAIILMSGCVSSGVQDKFNQLQQIENKINDKSNDITTTSNKLQTRGSSLDSASIDSALELNKQMQTQLVELKGLVKEAQGITVELEKEKLSTSLKDKLTQIEDGNNHILAGTENLETTSKNMDKLLTFTKVLMEANKDFETASANINFAASALYANNLDEAKSKLQSAKSGLESAKTKIDQTSNIIYFKFCRDYRDSIDIDLKGVSELEQAITETENRDAMGAYSHEMAATSFWTSASGTLPTQSAIDTEIGAWSDQNIYAYTDKAADEFAQLKQSA